MDTKSIKQLENKIISLNKAYRDGKPLVSDMEYDNLVDKLKRVDPNNPIFVKGVIEKPSERMEDLPLQMASLEKVKSIKKLKEWFSTLLSVSAREVVIMPKYDGISLLTQGCNKAWTRGNGVQGQESTNHFKKIAYGVPYTTLQDGNTLNTLTWGEAIVPKRLFSDLSAEDDGFPYKNARNMVAGIFNSPEGYNSPYIRSIFFVRYGVDKDLNKSDSLDWLSYNFRNSSPYEKISLKKLMGMSEEALEIYFDRLFVEFGKEYAIDGLVFEVEEKESRKSLGRLPNGNPRYSVAYKREEWLTAYTTKVVKIECNIGKSGAMTPVIVVEPVQMEGVTVSRVTGYNASYLIANHICPGATISIIRSGDVIPKHVKTLKYYRWEFDDMMDEICICPSCGRPMAWNETNVDLVCTNKHCPDRVIAEMVYFFRTMGCEQFEEPTIRRLYSFGYKTIDTILESHVSEFQRLLGKSKGKTVFSKIKKVLDGVPFARYLTAINVFDGKIAEETCQKILDGLNGEIVERLCDPNSYELTEEFAASLKHECELIPGIGDVLALTFIKGLKTYLSRGKDKRIVITYVQSPKIEIPEGVEQMHVCMTGFRNKELEKALQAQGHVVLNSVTKECTVLVVADINSTSSKMKTAKQRGLRIVTREDFENEILL